MSRTPALGASDWRSLYARDADVVFAAAGYSGFGVFEAATDQSEVTGRQLWAIGVDNDQWFDVGPDQQAHILTSVIKRGDVAAFRLVEHMLSGGPVGEAFRLGIAEDGFDYSQQGDRLTPEMVARLDEIMADIGEGRIKVPTIPAGPTMAFDVLGNEVDPSEIESTATGLGAAPGTTGVDGLAQYAPIDSGTYQLESLGTPITVTLEGNWWVQSNIPGQTVFTHPDSERPADRDVVSCARPCWPTRPNLGHRSTSRSTGRWLGNLVDGIVTEGPESTRIGGRDAVYFEVEITDDRVCGSSGYCVGFVINTFDDQGISGWAFELGYHQRVWWADGGDHEPLVIIAGTPSTDRSFQSDADRVLDSLVIGEPGPHPVADPGT